MATRGYARVEGRQHDYPSPELTLRKRRSDSELERQSACGQVLCLKDLALL